MLVRKLIIGAAIAATAVLSACGSPQPEPVLAAGSQNSSVQSATATTTTPPTTSSSSAVAPSSSTSSSTSTSTKTTTPKTTTPKPTTKTTTPKPPPPPQSTEAPCSTAAKACIKLSTNQTWLMDNGKVVYGPVKITSGRPGYLTPAGKFNVTFKDKDHKSKEFNMAPMPYSVFFNGGIAFHQGSLSVKSHGCIHLSMAAAQKYFSSLSVGDLVEVVR